MANAPLPLDRSAVLAFRRRAGLLDERVAPGAESLRRAGWAGLQDSMPRAALLSVHARVAGAHPAIWEDPALVQLWGPRYSAYAVPAADVAVFTLGRLPVDAAKRRFAEDLAKRLAAFLDGRRLPHNEIERAMGLRSNVLRYAAPTGTVLIRWDGARQPLVWSVPRPEVDPGDARLEMARRFVHVFGPTTPEAFAEWAGIRPPGGAEAFRALGGSLLPARTPGGDAWILAEDEPAFREPPGPAAAARLLPSGDAWFLHHRGPERALLVPDADRRAQLWTSRVWPGALLLGGDVAGTWRRADATLTVEPWRTLSAAERAAVEAEAAGLPLPGLRTAMTVRWVG